MKAFKKLTFVTLAALSVFGTALPAFADEETITADQLFTQEELASFEQSALEGAYTDPVEPPLNFNSAQTIQEVAQAIEEFYGNGNVVITEVPKYSFRSVTSNGNMGHYVTHTGWVHGSQMVTWNKVGNAQRNAVIARMGYFDPNRSYFMKTTQNIINASRWQTQGYYTLSVTAYCFYPG